MRLLRLSSFALQPPPFRLRPSGYGGPVGLPPSLSVLRRTRWRIKRRTRRLAMTPVVASDTFSFLLLLFYFDFKLLWSASIFPASICLIIFSASIKWFSTSVGCSSNSFRYFSYSCRALFRARSWLILPAWVKISLPESLRKSSSLAIQQFIEVIAASGPLKPFVIHGKTLDDIFPQTLCGPNAELSAPL